MIIAMRIRLQGFIIFDYAALFGAARKQLAQWLAEGKIQRKETIVKGGLKAAEQALLDLYRGINTGTFLFPPQTGYFLRTHVRMRLCVCFTK
jgi:NADPH-dependent curcumin reductase CurA